MILQLILADVHDDEAELLAFERRLYQPHYKHIAPEPKRIRYPVPNSSFTRLNLPAIIVEMEQLLGTLAPSRAD